MVGIEAGDKPPLAPICIICPSASGVRSGMTWAKFPGITACAFRSTASRKPPASSVTSALREVGDDPVVAVRFPLGPDRPPAGPDVRDLDLVATEVVYL